MEIILILASSVITAIFSVVGFFIVRVLNNLEGSVKELTVGLAQTTLELAKFISKTEAILKNHEDVLDAHSERLNAMRR